MIFLDTIKEILIIAAAIVVAYFVIVGLALTFLKILALLLRLKFKVNDRQYMKLIAKENEIARQNRLQEVDWNGLPFPNHTPSEIHITQDQIEAMPSRANLNLSKAYRQRADDLRSDVTFLSEAITGDLIVTFTPRSRK